MFLTTCRISPTRGVNKPRFMEKKYIFNKKHSESENLQRA